MSQYGAEPSSGASDGSSTSPTQRSKYEKKPDDLMKEPAELYYVGQNVYLLQARARDINPYKIYKVLGTGQYKLERDGKSDGKVYEAAKLSTKPQV